MFVLNGAVFFMACLSSPQFPCLILSLSLAPGILSYRGELDPHDCDGSLQSSSYPVAM